MHRHAQLSYNEILFSLKKKENADTGYNMDEP
jgi:hypothetical protein